MKLINSHPKKTRSRKIFLFLFFRCCYPSSLQELSGVIYDVQENALCGVCCLSKLTVPVRKRTHAPLWSTSDTVKSHGVKCVLGSTTCAYKTFVWNIFRLWASNMWISLEMRKEIMNLLLKLSIYLSGFITAVAVFRKPNAIPLCFSIGLVSNQTETDNWS